MKKRTNYLNGKKILLFSVYFFDYQNIICNKLKELGAKVVLYDERSVSSALEKALLKIEPYIYKNKTKKYYDKIIEKHKGEIFDYILIIKCDMPDEKILHDIKQAFPKAKMCLHLWDSVRNIPHILDKIKFFDIATSFDRVDCVNYPEFEFRPLFYADEFKAKDIQSDFLYDISFCGTIHSDRFKILKPIKQQCEQLGFRYFGFHYLQSNFIYKFYKFTKEEFRNTKIEEFDFNKKPSTEIVNIVNKSRSIVDIQHPKQTGLTMRTVEMLGMKKKLITTNTDIVNYDFYNPNNILIIDREKPKIDFVFLNTSYQNVDEHIYEKYSIECWICDVLGIEE